jgi:hypothetical protein
MRITMKETRFGSPDGSKVNEYEAGKAYDVPPDLANDFIAAGVAVSDEPDQPITLTWPPTDEQLNEMSFSALGVLLEDKGIALGPLKGVDARLAAIRNLIADENTAADKPVLPTDADIDGMDESTLATLLTARGIDVGPIPTLDEGKAKLKELIAGERAAQA